MEKKVQGKYMGRDERLCMNKNVPHDSGTVGDDLREGVGNDVGEDIDDDDRKASHSKEHVLF